MSAINQLATLDEQLFTELTPEQSEIVEGGKAMIRIIDLLCVKAGGDTFGADDTYISLSGHGKVWGDVGMDTGDTKEVNIDREMKGGFVRVSLFDSDGFFNGSDDYMGGFNVSGVDGKRKTVRVSGGGSIYDVTYGTYETPDF